MKAAIIAAIVALLVLATSATAAFVVTSKNIKNGTIQTVDISAKAKRALKGNLGPAGRQGPVGATGPQGLAGPQGPPGPAHITTVWSPESLVGDNETNSAIAICPTGQVPISGGHSLAFNEVTAGGQHTIIESKAVDGTHPIDGWEITIKRVYGADNTWSRFWAIAYCVPGTND